MAERGRLSGAIGVGRRLDQAIHIGNAGFGGEIVHLVVHEEAKRAGGDVGAPRIVEGGGDTDGVALFVDYQSSGWCRGIRCAGRRFWGRVGESLGDVVDRQREWLWR